MLYDHPVTRVPSLQFLLSKVNMRYFNKKTMILLILGLDNFKSASTTGMLHEIVWLFVFPCEIADSIKSVSNNISMLVISR